MPVEQDEELGRLARVLTGDAGRAAAVLGEVAVLAARPTRPDQEGQEDGRALLVQRLLHRPPLSSTADQAADAGLPAGDSPPDLEVRLARLDALGRTLLVLRHGEHLTLAELARMTDRSPAAVTRALEQAELATGAAPYEIEQLIWKAEAPPAGAVREAVGRATLRRRRRHLWIVTAGITAAVLVTAATVLPGLLREQPYVRAYGEWTATAQLAPQGTYKVEGRQLTAGEEVLGIVAATDPDSTCSVTVTTASKRIAVPVGRKAALGDRPARFVESSLLTDAGLWWSVGSRTSALAQCDGNGDDQTLLDLARQVRFVPVPLRVPYDLRGLPPEDEVHSYLDYLGTSGVLVAPRGADEESPNSVFVGVIAEMSAGAVSGRRVDISGSAGRMADDEDDATVCWPAASHTVCAAINGPGSPGGRAERSRRTARVLRTARAVRLADLDQPETWFEARDALPR